MLQLGDRISAKNWQISLTPGLLEQKRIRFDADGVPRIDLLLMYDRLIATLQFDFAVKPLSLMAPISSPDDRVLLSLDDAEIDLYVNGCLVDQEWYAGSLGEPCCTVLEMEAEVLTGAKPRPELPDVVSRFENIQGWKPEGYNLFAGDCMPFADGDTFHLFYLRDRRGHHSKWTLGAHVWAHVSSKDLVHWEEHPDAIRLEDQAEGSICTGSVIRYGSGYRAYFAVRMSDKSPARVTWADSDDLIHFKRSASSFLLKAPYEPVTARDPYAYYDADEALFHLLITTSIQRDDGFHGVVADFVSPDMKEWVDRAPLVEFDSTTKNQPACPDLFEKDGIWYFLYRDPQRVNRYFYSKNKRGPWIAPPDNFVIGSEYIVPKATVFDGRILFAAFKKDDPARYYGGTLWLFEAIPDGTGKLKFVKL